MHSLSVAQIADNSLFEVEDTRLNAMKIKQVKKKSVLYW
jgi:hypothetical protein